MRTDEHTTPPWRGFERPNVLKLPTSKDCPNKCAGCKLSKGHGLINDAEECFREFMNECEPNSDQEMDDLAAIKQYTDAIMKSERAMRDILLRNGTDCPDAERCRCL